MRKRLAGSASGLLAALALGFAMLPLRDHLNPATAGLVLVVPVILGVIVGGFAAGLVSVAAGFLVYDSLFIPPFGTLTVGSGEDWIALGVYVVVMVLVSRIVSELGRAQVAARSREASARLLLHFSELLLVERSASELVVEVVGYLRSALGVSGVAIVLSVEGRLEVAASSGVPIGPGELPGLRAPDARLPVALSTTTSHEVIQTLALVASGIPVGLLVLRDLPENRDVREVLPVVANHLATAMERSELRERILHAELLEEVDRLRRTLIGAVSHDLRTPLATIKVASSTLLGQPDALDREDANELYQLIDMQVDRLTRLVNSLLDMTRIQSGALELRRSPFSVRQLATEALTELASVLGEQTLDLQIAEDLPDVDVDPLLIVQVLTNLLDNANRHAPHSTITVAARQVDLGHVEISVADHGPGVPASERTAVFEEFVRFDTGGRSGLGLAIAKAFVEAHGGRIWVGDSPGGGARFAFTLPSATERQRVLLP